MSDLTPNQIEKAELRAGALAKREAMPAQQRVDAANAIAARDFPVPVPKGAIVSGFSPMKSEINPIPLMRKLFDAGAQLALPVIVGRGKPLIMRAWKFGDPFKAGQWGIREPVAEAPEVHPDILIVPLAAFDRRGHRIGFGAGYYDMTIAALRAKKRITAVGIAFSVQEIERVPSTDRDARLDFMLTEREVIDFSKG
jgi:5-formyltetrahydrofolate cyclo-ligase